MEGKTVFEGDTSSGHYIVSDTVYSGRQARVLFSGKYQAAQSGVATDGKPALLFDYNERFMEIIRGVRPARVLQLGGGACTLPIALQKELPEVHLDIVEIDDGLLAIAKQYFDFQPGHHTQLFTMDAREFITTSTSTYDLIIIDVFVHDTIPESLQTVEVARHLQRMLSPQGLVLINLISAYYGQRSALLTRLLAALGPAYTTIELFPAGRNMSLWLPQNFVLAASSHPHDLSQYVLQPPLDLPNMNAASPLRDADVQAG